MIEILLPEIGVDVTHAIIVQWNFKPGEKVKAGDVLLEVMTNKVNVEIESKHDGVLREILYKADDEVPVGMVIGKLEVEA